MNLQTIRKFARKFKKTTVSNDPNVDLDEEINIANGEIHMLIMEAEGYENIGGGFKATDLLSASGLVESDNGYNGEYSFPGDAVKIDEFHLNYGDGYVKAEIIDKSDLESSLFEDDGYYSQYAPKVFVFRDSYFVRPLNNGATVVDGIKLVTQLRAETLVDDNDSPSWEASFHLLLPLRVALDYYLVYPEKYNPHIDKKARELEAQLISKVESENQKETVFRAVKEQF